MNKNELFEKLTDVLGEYTSESGTIWLKENVKETAMFDEMVDRYGMAVSDELRRYENKFDVLAMQLLAMSDIMRTIRDNY